MKKKNGQRGIVLNLLGARKSAELRSQLQPNRALGHRTSIGSSAQSNRSHLMPTKESRMSEKSKLPERIAGMAFTTADCRVIQHLSEAYQVSQSHVVRSCFGIGLQVYSDVQLQSKINSAAKYHAESERDVIQAAAKLGLANTEFEPWSNAEHSEKGEEGERLQSKAKYPKRVAGLAFSEADYNAVRRISSNREVSEAHVVRECVSIGLAIYTDDRLRRLIEHAAISHGRRERDIVYSAIMQGLNEALVWLRLNTLLWIRDQLRAEDPHLDLKLTEHIHAVMGDRQPVRLIDPDNALLLYGPDASPDDFLLDYEEVYSSQIKAQEELQRLRQVWNETPLDEHDQLLASYLDCLDAEAKERDQRRLEARQARRSELLELHGVEHEEDS